MQKQREAERRKRARDAQSINLTSQSEIMAHFEKQYHDGVNPLPDPSSVHLGLQTHTDDEEVL